MSSDFLLLMWFVVGFFSNVWLTYRLRVGPYTADDLLISAIISFAGPIGLGLVLLGIALDKLAKIKITKD